MNSPKQLFLVSDGDYSDYRVLGVYSTAELAEQARVAYGAENEVETIALDAVPAMPPGLLPWVVWMYDNGRWSARRESAHDFEEREYRQPTRTIGGASYPGYVSVYCWARDEEHARKIAAEKRVGLLHLESLEQMRQQAEHEAAAPTIPTCPAGESKFGRPAKGGAA